MHHRLLLGSTALVGAGMLFASAASAQEGAGFEVILGGFTEFGVNAATGDTLDNSGDTQNYGFFMDNEIIVRAQGITDGGIRYGSKIEIEVAGGGDAGSEGDGISIDEAGLFFSGNFGRVELGRDDGAEDLMFVGAEDAQAGTGGIDGDTSNLGQIQFPDMGDDVKATYFTPRFAGFQLGVSFTPDGDDNNNGIGNDALDGGDGRKNAIGGGINWVGVLGPVDLTLSAVGNLADVKGSGDAQGPRASVTRPRRSRSALCSASAASASAPATTTMRGRWTARKASSRRSVSPMASARPMSVSVLSRTGTMRRTTPRSSRSVATSA